MSKPGMNLQDSFLNQVRRENTELKVLLTNGTVLRGIVKGFDNFTLILSNRNGQHLVYKHAIAQLVSHRPMGHRPHGDDHAPAHEEATHEEQTGDSTLDTGASQDSHASVEKTGQEPSGDPKAKPRKEGFNKLDLSGVKLGEKSE